MKSLASKVKSLASRPQVLENWSVFGSKTALFFELLKFCGTPEKFFFCEDLFFFWRALALVSLVLGFEHSCPWPRGECLSLALDFFVSLALASSLVSSTPPLYKIKSTNTTSIVNMLCCLRKNQQYCFSHN